MNSRVLLKHAAILAAAVWALAAIVWAAGAAPPEMVTICHAAGQAGEPANWVELTLPYDAIYGTAGHFSEPGSTNAGHERDYEGPCVVEPTATPVPTDEPPATPTDEPTQEPTSEPTAEPTAEPTQEPTGEPTEEPTEEPTIEPTPTEVGPTPTEVVEATPPPCNDDPCAFLFHLIGPNGEEADFASFSQRDDGTFYLPSTQATLKCLGWVAVSAPYGRPIGPDEAALLLRCWGGRCEVDN